MKMIAALLSKRTTLTTVTRTTLATTSLATNIVLIASIGLAIATIVKLVLDYNKKKQDALNYNKKADYKRNKPDRKYKKNYSNNNENQRDTIKSNLDYLKSNLTKMALNMGHKFALNKLSKNSK